MELIEDADDGLRYQEERVYGDEEDEGWWNKFCVPDLEEHEWITHWRACTIFIPDDVEDDGNEY